MGTSASKLFANVFSGQDMRVLMIGIDGAGKTTILYKLKLGETVTAITTINFNVETVSYKNISFTIWDVGARNVALRRHYYQNTQGVIVVVDSSDTSRINEAAERLHQELNCDELRDAFVLIFANKQDLPNALSTSQLTNRMRLHQLHQQWYVQASCAATGDGLYEGLDWLAKMYGNPPRPKAA